MAADPVKTCQRKLRYNDMLAAVMAAKIATKRVGKRLVAYRCPLAPEHYHIGTRYCGDHGTAQKHQEVLKMYEKRGRNGHKRLRQVKTKDEKRIQKLEERNEGLR